MNNLFTEYREFLSDNFKGLSLPKQLFYSWNYGLQFDLQSEQTTENACFVEVVRRAATVFEIAFQPSDHLIFVFLDYKYRKTKIQIWKLCF